MLIVWSYSLLRAKIPLYFLRQCLISVVKKKTKKAETPSVWVTQIKIEHFTQYKGCGFCSQSFSLALFMASMNRRMTTLTQSLLMSYVAIWHVTRFTCQSLNTETLGQYLCTGISHWCIAGQSLHDTCRCSYQRCWYISWTGDTLLFRLHIHPHLHKKKRYSRLSDRKYGSFHLYFHFIHFIFTVGHTHYAFKITQNTWLGGEKRQLKKIFVLKYSKTFSSFVVCISTIN